MYNSMEERRHVSSCTYIIDAFIYITFEQHVYWWDETDDFEEVFCKYLKINVHAI